MSDGTPLTFKLCLFVATKMHKKLKADSKSYVFFNTP
jgi:hypothetical protein